jgi:hypothetical protein
MEPNLNQCLHAYFRLGNYIGSEDEFRSLEFEEAFHGHVMIKSTIAKTTWLEEATSYLSDFEDLPEALLKLNRGEVSNRLSANLHVLIVRKSLPHSTTRV